MSKTIKYVECAHCGETVGTYYVTCPYCGYKLAVRRPTSTAPQYDGRPRVWFHAVGRVRRGCGHAKIPRTYDTRIEHGGMLREKHAPMFFGNRTIPPPHTHRVMRGYGVTATSLP